MPSLDSDKLLRRPRARVEELSTFGNAVSNVAAEAIEADLRRVIEEARQIQPCRSSLLDQQDFVGGEDALLPSHEAVEAERAAKEVFFHTFCPTMKETQLRLPYFTATTRPSATNSNDSRRKPSSESSSIRLHSSPALAMLLIA